MADKTAAYKVTWVTDQLGVGSAPMSYPQLEAIRAQGVDAILNLCGEFCDLHDIEKGAGFEVHYLPLADEEAPGLIELEKTLPGWTRPSTWARRCSFTAATASAAPARCSTPTCCGAAWGTSWRARRSKSSRASQPISSSGGPSANTASSPAS